MFKLPEDMESKYRFVTLAALRAEQLQAGALPRVSGPPPTDKPPPALADE